MNTLKLFANLRLPNPKGFFKRSTEPPLTCVFLQQIVWFSAIPDAYENKKIGSRRQRSTINKIVQYFERAKVIDRVRVLLHHRQWNQDTAEALAELNLDTFVVGQVLTSRTLKPETALAFFNWLQSNPRFWHNQQSVHAMIKLLSLNQKIEEMESLVDDIRAGKYRKKICVSFMDLLKWYSRARNLEGVERAWSEMQKVLVDSGKSGNAEAYNIYMDLLGENCRYRQIADLFLDMVGHGILPNARTHTVIMRHLVKMGKLDRALELFKRLPGLRIKHTSKQYSVLVDGFCNVRDVGKLVWLIEEMEKDGILPGRALCSAVEVLQEAGLYEEVERIRTELLVGEDFVALEMLKELDFSGEDDADSDGNESGGDDNCSKVEQVLKPWMNPNALATALNDWNSGTISALESANLIWNTRLVCKVLRGIKNIDAAWSFFMWVSYQPGFVHDIYTVSRMIVMFARNGRAAAVDRLLEKAKADGLKLSITTFRLIIEAYGKSKDPEAAFSVFNQVGPFGFLPNSLLYSSLIHTLVKCEAGQKAVEVLEEMMVMNVKMDVQILEGLMEHFAIKGDLKAMQLMFQWIKESGNEPDAQAYRILIRGYCKNGAAAIAFRLFEDMERSGFLLDAKSKTLLVNSLWEEGRLKEAALIEDKVERNRRELPKTLPGSIWRASFAELMEMYDFLSKTLG